MSQRYIGGLIYNPPGGFSGYFDGSGDYLSVADNAAFNFGTGDFTIECWINLAAAVSVADWQIVAKGSSNFVLDINNSSKKFTFAQYGVAVLLTSNTATVPGVWFHVAVTRSGTSLRMFVNGVLEASTTSSANLTSSAALEIARDPVGATARFNGYISNIRLLKGTALYTADFTPPVGPLQAITNTSLLTCAYPTFRDGSSNNFTITVNGNTAVSTQNPFPQTQLPNPALGNQGNGVYSMSQYQALRSQNLWPAIDPYFDYVTLMLHGNGTNGAQNNTFLDSSTNNFTITRNGNTTQGTFTPYGSNWSNYFDNSGGYLTAPSNAALSMGTGQFWFEAWIFMPTAPSTQYIVLGTNAGSGSSALTVRIQPSALRVDRHGVASYDSNTVTWQYNAWQHIAVGRDSSNTLYFFVNGVSVGTRASTTDNFAGESSAIGRIPADAGSAYFNGFISSLRLLKGTCLYTASFTPSISPLTAITNTSLLTCQSNRFIDNSSNNFAITLNGTVSVQRFSPFNPTTPYAAGTIGGSGYFDGSGDILSIANNAAFAPGTGDFTLECWAYHTTSSTATVYFSQGTGGLAFYRNASNQLELAQDAVAVVLTSTATIPVNAWTHVATSRSGTTLRLFINGSQVASATNSTNFSGSGPEYISASGNGSSFPMTGYISDIRLLKGTALYTSSTYTVPTAPLTNIANTSFLANFTNGGIIDNAMMNDLETVGNAQISTSVSKFGGGSMYFDGTGDGLLIPHNNILNIGGGDFTAECWVYPIAKNNSTIFYKGPVTGPNYDYFLGWDGATLTVIYGPSTVGTMTDTTTLNAWNHVALVRSGSTMRVYINGVQQYSATYTGTYASTANGGVGYTPGLSNNYVFNGYIDDLRITKYARYTANFTPQRSQWQDQ